ncbi:MAG: response regulator [Pseudomonadota bacterium]
MEVGRVVIVEDDVLSSIALTQLLQEEGFDVKSYTSTDSAYAECSVNPPDLLIADWCVPGELSTQKLVEYLHERNPKLRVIFTSGYEPDELRGLTSNKHWMSYISKPIPFDRLVEDIIKTA